ncbi:MAG: hypothetical protein QHC40_01060 [Sphingobium sp.]|nr:hypothetical protein [Sphingobium sp.]
MARQKTDEIGYKLRTRQFSNELQFQGKAFDNRLDYVFGLFYLNQTDVVDSALVGSTSAPPHPAGLSSFACA